MLSTVPTQMLTRCMLSSLNLTATSLSSMAPLSSPVAYDLSGSSAFSAQWYSLSTIPSCKDNRIKHVCFQDISSI